MPDTLAALHVDVVKYPMYYNCRMSRTRWM